MSKGRLEAFTDGVIAIIITIMVLEMKVPHDVTRQALAAVWPIFLSYVLSFITVGIYWNGHHHMFHAVKRVNGLTLWANLHLLFWLSLMPFATGWMGEHHFAPVPVVLYGVVLLMTAIAFYLVVRALVSLEGADSDFALRIGAAWKGKASLIAYSVGLGLAVVDPRISLALDVAVAAMWFIPDRRFEG